MTTDTETQTDAMLSAILALEGASLSIPVGLEVMRVRDNIPDYGYDRDAAHEVLTAIAQDHLITEWVAAFRQVAQPDKDLQRLFWATNGKEIAGDFVIFTAAFACPATICRAALLAVRRKNLEKER